MYLHIFFILFTKYKILIPHVCVYHMESIDFIYFVNIILYAFIVLYPPQNLCKRKNFNILYHTLIH